MVWGCPGRGMEPPCRWHSYTVRGRHVSFPPPASSSPLPGAAQWDSLLNIVALSSWFLAGPSMPPPAQPASQPSPSADVSERALTVLVKSGRVLPRRGCGWSESMEICYMWPQAAQLGVGNQGCLSSAPALLCPVATEALRAEFSFTSTQRWGVLNRSMLNLSWVAVPQNCPLST